MQFSNQVTIRRPVHDVFSFVADMRNAPRWNYAIVETRQTTSGPVGLGTTYSQIRSLPSRSEETLEVTEFEPDRRFAITGDLGPFHGTLTYDFEDLGDETRLINTADLEARGLAKLAGPLASGRIRDAVAENLNTLKQLLERGTA